MGRTEQKINIASLFTTGWSCTKGGGAARPRCSRDRCSATAGRLDEWSGGYCSSRVPLQKPPTSSVWFAFPWDLTILSTSAGPGSTHPSHRLAAPAAPHLGVPGRQLISFSASATNNLYMQISQLTPMPTLRGLVDKILACTSRGPGFETQWMPFFPPFFLGVT